MSLNDPKMRTALGLATQADVTGAPAPAPSTLLEESQRDFIYAEVWSRPGMDRRARYLVSIAGTALCDSNSEQLEAFVYGALKTGVITLSEMREAALHLCIYGGWGRGQSIDRAATKAARALGLPDAESPPIRAELWDPEVRTSQGSQAFKDVMTFQGPGPTRPFYTAGILNFVFGEMWQREGLDERSRRWLTLVGVCESCAVTPIKSHLYASMASGNITADELHEFVLHYALHAGWPKASVIQGAANTVIENFVAGKQWFE
jgi:4-carboxymuconolactone decarboxylase